MAYYTSIKNMFILRFVFEFPQDMGYIYFRVMTFLVLTARNKQADRLRNIYVHLEKQQTLFLEG